MITNQKRSNLKQTDIDRIPKNWKVLKIADIGEVITGTTPSTKVKEYWGEGYPFVTPTDFSDSKYVPKTERSVSPQGIRVARLIPKNTIMVTCIASVGEVSMASQECITNQQINSIISRRGIDPNYVYYAMLFRKGILKNWAGITTSPIIKKSLFEKFPIPLPPLPEQQKIAEVLGMMDEAIEKVDKAIEKTQRLKKGLMQELLTKGIGHKEFKDTKIGRIPKEWEVVKIHDLFDVETGTTPPTKKKEYWENGNMNWFTPTDLSKLINEIYIIESERKITKEAIKEVSMTILPGKSLILSTRAPVGYIAVTLDEATFNQGCKGLVPKDFSTLHSEFYCYYLQNKKYILQMQSGGSTFKELAKERIENFQAPKLSIKEQMEITKKIRTVDKQYELLQKRRNKFTKVKIGLMNDLLTGKKRVKV